MYMDRDFVGELTPLLCRNGPIKNQQCRDFNCCAIYIVMVGLAIFFSLLSMGGLKMTADEIQKKMSQQNFGAPIYSVIEAAVPIAVSLCAIAAFCMIAVITSVTFPTLVVTVHIPFICLSLLTMGTAFIARYFGKEIPLLSLYIQNKFMVKSSEQSLVIGIGFLSGFLIILLMLISKKSKIKNIVHVLRIAKTVFWSNYWIIFAPFIFTALTIACIVGNLALMSVSLTRKTNIIHKNTATFIIVIQSVVTYGVVLALSHFFFVSIALHWYHKKRREYMKDSSFGDTFFLTLSQIGTHIGTIVSAFVVALVPEYLSSRIGLLEGKASLIYHIFCFPHKYFLKYFSKYCFFQTVLQSMPFDQACVEMYGLRQRARKIIGPIYMMGSLYDSIMKVFCLVFGILLCYFLIAHSEISDILDSTQKWVGPLAIILLGGIEITSHFLNIIGLMGDIIVFAYFADIEIEKRDFGDSEPYNCPNEIRDIIYEVKAGQNYIVD